MAKFLVELRLIIEIAWKVLVGIINLPIALVELGWLRIFYPDRFKERIKELKEAWNGNR